MPSRAISFYTVGPERINGKIRSKVNIHRVVEVKGVFNPRNGNVLEINLLNVNVKSDRWSKVKEYSASNRLEWAMSLIYDRSKLDQLKIKSYLRSVKIYLEDISEKGFSRPFIIENYTYPTKQKIRKYTASNIYGEIPDIDYREKEVDPFRVDSLKELPEPNERERRPVDDFSLYNKESLYLAFLRVYSSEKVAVELSSNLIEAANISNLLPPTISFLINSEYFDRWT